MIHAAWMLTIDENGKTCARSFCFVKTIRTQVHTGGRWVITETEIVHPDHDAELHRYRVAEAGNAKLLPTLMKMLDK